jgi:hypothetical protein
MLVGVLEVASAQRSKGVDAMALELQQAGTAWGGPSTDSRGDVIDDAVVSTARRQDERLVQLEAMGCQLVSVQVAGCAALLGDESGFVPPAGQERFAR